MRSYELIEKANNLKAQHQKIREEGDEIYIASMKASQDFSDNPSQENLDRVKGLLDKIQEIREKGQKVIDEIDLLLPQIEEKQAEEKAELLELTIALENFSKS